MSRYVTVAALGPPPPRANGPLGHGDVERMISFWKAEFAQVIPDQPDLVVVPEACDRFAGPSWSELQAYYRLRGTRVLDFFREIARQQRCHLTYSAITEMPDGTWRNSTQLIDRDGEVVGVYHKTHTVITETTEQGIFCGRNAPIITCELGSVACAICFDLNFDELRTRYAAARPDMILFSSMYHGGLMQAYWAYSCRAHLVSAVAGLPCAVISPVGHVLAQSTNYFDHIVARVNLDCRVVHLDFNWERLRALKARYGPRVSIFDPGYLGSVLVSSETESVRVEHMMREFDIEPLDDYLARSLAHHHDPSHIEPSCGG